MLDAYDQNRFRRQLLLQGWTAEHQERIRDLKVFVGGVGGSGSAILTQLALLGVGTFRIADFDDVELSNLNRQFLHCVSPDDRLGKNKALSGRDTILCINPRARVHAFPGRFDVGTAEEMIGDADIVFDGLDTFEGKILLGDWAVKRGIPFVFPGPVDLGGYACVFHPPTTACHRCVLAAERVPLWLRAQQVCRSPMFVPVCSPSVMLTSGHAILEALATMFGLGDSTPGTFFMFLTRASEDIGGTRSWRAFRFWLTDHMLELSRKQGFDWDRPWTGDRLVQLELEPRPGCEGCSHLR